MANRKYPSYKDEVDFSILKGLTLKSVSKVGDYNDEIRFLSEDGREFVMHHLQDCCESVYIEDIDGDLTDLVGTPIELAEKVSNWDEPWTGDYEPESYTWTFYKLATVKGYVTIRWFGSSNGYYSEGVNFGEIKDQTDG